MNEFMQLIDEVRVANHNVHAARQELYRRKADLMVAERQATYAAYKAGRYDLLKLDYAAIRRMECNVKTAK